MTLWSFKLFLFFYVPLKFNSNISIHFSISDFVKFNYIKMCGIWAVFGHSTNIHSLCGSTFEKIAHRGPDAWRIEYDSKLKVI